MPELNNEEKDTLTLDKSPIQQTPATTVVQIPDIDPVVPPDPVQDVIAEPVIAPMPLASPVEKPTPLFKAAEVEKEEEGLGGKIKNIFGGWFGGNATPEPATPVQSERSTLEIRQMLIDEVEKSLRPHRRRGAPIPYNYAIIHIVEANPSAQEQIVSAIDDLQPKLQEAVLQRLRSGRYELPRDFAVEVRIYPNVPSLFVEAFKENDVFVELCKQQQQSVVGSFRVLKGSASQEVFQVKANQLYHIGRLASIENERGQLIRQNHLYFFDPSSLDPSDPNRSINDTVSRYHARIEYDPAKNKFVFVNEQGSSGFFRDTLRDTQKLKPNQSVQLQSGDIFYLGTACIRFEG